MLGAPQLILVRHAATDANLRVPPVLQGKRMDLPLSDLGREQAGRLANALSGLSFERVVCSPLQRAVETAEAVAAAHAVPVEINEAIIEIDIGDWEGLSWPEIESRWPVEHAAFHADCAQYGYLGGENLTQVCKRAQPVLERLLRETQGRVLVVGHNVLNRAVLANWLGIPLHWSRRLPQDNAAYSIVEWTGKPAVRSINLVAHLSALSEPH